MTSTLQPDPSMIGGVPKVPLAHLPDPGALFARRAERFDFLAGYSANLAPYLRFLAGICRAQQAVGSKGVHPDPGRVFTASRTGKPHQFQGVGQLAADAGRGGDKHGNARTHQPEHAPGIIGMGVAEAALQKEFDDKALEAALERAHDAARRKRH